jgi:hypothetical protein
MSVPESVLLRSEVPIGQVAHLLRRGIFRPHEGPIQGYRAAGSVQGAGK